jgi:hypothetical protein
VKSKELLVIDSFDDFWRVASKLMPTANPHTRSHSPPPLSISRPLSTDTTNVLDRDGAYSMRSVPVRIYLPDGPVIQEVAPPLREDGKIFLALPSFLSEFVYLPFIYRHSSNTFALFFHPSASPFPSTSTAAAPIAAESESTSAFCPRTCLCPNTGCRISVGGRISLVGRLLSWS